MAPAAHSAPSPSFQPSESSFLSFRQPFARERISSCYTEVARGAGENRMSSSLLDPTPAADTSHKVRPMAFVVATLVILSVFALWYTFRYYPEKKAADKFFTALVAGNTDEAYKIWKPTASYQMKDFLADWGTSGYYGPIKSYRIDKAEARRSASGVIVTVSLSPFSPVPEPSDAEKSQKT